MFTAYGGAKGGGKTWAVRTKAIGGAIFNPGIKILIMRSTFREVDENHITPICNEVIPLGIAKYNNMNHRLTFTNGSVIQFGNWEGEESERHYNGLEYDWIFIDEATQFCLHPDTELLLERGWTRVDETFRGDKVLSLNKDGTQEFKPIEQMYCFSTDEDMYYCKQKNGVSFCVTHGHKIPVKNLSKHEDGIWRFREVQDIRSGYIARCGEPIDKADVEWYEGFSHHPKGHNEADRVKMDDWLEFLGWYMSEGSSFTRADGRTPKISIRQTKPCESLKAMMDRLPWRYSYREDGNYLIYSGQLYDLLHPMGNLYQKRVPSYVFDLNKRQIEIFLRAFEIGDGHVDGRHGGVGIGLANEGLIDDLQRLYTLTGRIATKGYSKVRGFDVYRLTVQRETANRFTRVKNDIHTVPYSGLVWCPTVADNHNFVIRYNGRVSVTGNTERAFNFLGGCLRGVNDFPKRMYLTCNPGGVGHAWVKRLFIDKVYKTNSDNPEENENPEDYSFIFATVEDNKYLLESSPLYLRNLANMPEDVRRAYRYGDWDAIGGNYFKEFSRKVHVVKPFAIPNHWERYRAFDYGLDMFSCFWCAVDGDGRLWVYRHYEHKDLIISDAAKQALEHTPMTERIRATYAPPDMWNRQRETGRTMYEVFAENGLPIIRSDNNRVQGHMLMKEMLAEKEVGDPFVKQYFKKERLPMLMFLDTVEQKVFSDIESIQADDDNPNDCAKQPHDVTHCVTGDTLIATPNGNIPIKDLNSFGICYAWDGEKVVERMHTPSHVTQHNADVYELELENGEKIKATAEHPVLTAAGWKRIDELTLDDDIIRAF